MEVSRRQIQEEQMAVLRNAANLQNYPLTKCRPDTEDAREKIEPMTEVGKSIPSQTYHEITAYHKFIRKKEVCL